MKFYHRTATKPERVGVVAGSFNPPTIAHRELARAAAMHVDEVIYVIPREFPHKGYFGATLEERIEMLKLAGAGSRYSIAASERGLFLDIARECKEHFGSGVQLYFACGSDAAERIFTWDYGRPGVAEEMLDAFELLVAPRGESFRAPESWRDRVRVLEIGGAVADVSSTEVRERIARAEPWEHLVPEAIVERVREIYS